MRGDGSLGYLSRETSHYSSHHHNNDGISDDESLAVPVDDGICGHRSLDTSHSSSRNRGFYHSSDDVRGWSRSQDNRNYFHRNRKVYHFGVDGRGGNRSQETSHYSSCSMEETVGGDRRGGYGPSPSTITPITQVTMLYCCVYLLILIVLMILLMKMQEVVVRFMTEGVEVDLQRSSNLPFTMPEKSLMVTGEFYIGIIPAPLPPIIQVSLVDCWVFLFMVTREVEIGLIIANFLHITMVYYTLYTQDPPKELYQGVWKEIFHIKTILIILIQARHSTLIQACLHTLIETCHHRII